MLLSPYVLANDSCCLKRLGLFMACLIALLSAGKLCPDWLGMSCLMETRPAVGPRARRLFDLSTMALTSPMERVSPTELCWATCPSAAKYQQLYQSQEGFSGCIWQLTEGSLHGGPSGLALDATKVFPDSNWAAHSWPGWWKFLRGIPMLPNIPHYKKGLPTWVPVKTGPEPGTLIVRSVFYFVVLRCCLALSPLPSHLFVSPKEVMLQKPTHKLFHPGEAQTRSCPQTTA